MRVRRFWKIVVFGMVYAVAGAQNAATDGPQSVVQSVDVPTGERVVLTAEGRGVQVYQCGRKAEGTEWVFVAPEANLSVGNIPVGTHGAGPVWRHQDGSSVVGEVLGKMAAPAAGALPWLLLRSKSHEGNDLGLLAKVNFIQRVETVGGLAPAGGCEIGAVLRVAYTATYRFYGIAE